jgi:hypothetical protein
MWYKFWDDKSLHEGPTWLPQMPYIFSHNCCFVAVEIWCFWFRWCSFSYFVLVSKGVAITVLLSWEFPYTNIFRESVARRELECGLERLRKALLLAALAQSWFFSSTYHQQIFMSGREFLLSSPLQITLLNINSNGTKIG